MQKIVEFQGQEYFVKTDPAWTFARITKVDRVPARGPLADAIAEMTGRVSTTILELECPQDEQDALTEHLGFRFSKSRGWKSTYSSYQLKKLIAKRGAQNVQVLKVQN